MARRPPLTPDLAADLPEEVLASLLDPAPVGVAVFDAEGCFGWVNARLAAINGRPRAEHTGRRPVDLLGPAARGFQDVVDRVLAHGESVRDLEVSGVAHDGVDRHW